MTLTSAACPPGESIIEDIDRRLATVRGARTISFVIEWDVAWLRGAPVFAIVPFHRVLYLPLVVLHVSVAMRIAGYWFAFAELRRAGALGNAVALGLLPLAVVIARKRSGK